MIRMYPRALVTTLFGLALLSCSAAHGADTPWVVVPDVAPPPAPPSPGAVPRLDPDQLYVIDAKEPCFIMVSPPGRVSVSQDAGPLKVRGKFVGGAGKTETKTFTGKVVFTVEAIGSGRVELIVVKEGAKSPADVFRQMIDANVGPRPPDPPGPGPNPPDPPKPPPSPAPIPVEGNRVLVVYETADLPKLPEAQRQILFSRSVRDYLDTKCVTGADGKTKEWRIWDVDIDATAEARHWQDALKRKRDRIPWLVVSNGKTGWEGPLPETADAFLALVKKYLEP